MMDDRHSIDVSGWWHSIDVSGWWCNGEIMPAGTMATVDDANYERLNNYLKMVAKANSTEDLAERINGWPKD
jgi:hypothetical protein